MTWWTKLFGRRDLFKFLDDKELVRSACEEASFASTSDDEITALLSKALDESERLDFRGDQLVAYITDGLAPLRAVPHLGAKMEVVAQSVRLHAKEWGLPLVPAIMEAFALRAIAEYYVMGLEKAGLIETTR